MSVVLRAIDSNGSLVVGAGIRNPATVTLTAGQQYARQVSEIFGIQSFDGWIEAEASGSGLGVYTATGAWSLTQFDGSVARPVSTNFVFFHAGAAAVLVNPSTTRTANVTITTFGASSSQSIAIPPRNRVVTTLPGVVQIQSSEPLAAIERASFTGKLSMNAGVPLSDASPELVFPHAVVGGGYTSMLTLANVASVAQSVAVVWGNSSATVSLEPNTTMRVSIAELLHLPAGPLQAASLRVSTQMLFPVQSLVGVLDIENETGLVTIGARPASTDFSFPHVAQGDGLFTGLCFSAGERGASITIQVYPAAGGTPKIATITLGPYQQLGRLVSEFVPSVTTQTGGYIKIHSDQPIWSWEIYGSGQVLASAPPL
jgi:hypothetical protein